MKSGDFLKKQFCAALLALLFVLLTACGGTQSDGVEPELTAVPIAPQGSSAGASEANAESAAKPADTEPAESVNGASQTEAHAAFRAALTNLLDNRVLPDGTPCEPDSDLSGNRFAVCDIDHDGRDELILSFTTTYMAGQVAQIYDYDAAAQRLKLEFSEFPALTFYDNGMILADWSHNQGLAGRFWPYSLYRYDAAADSYACVGMVDAWDRGLTETNGAGASYPADIDTSGTGLVYYLMESGVYEEDAAPVDASVYNAWRDSYLGGASVLTLTDLALTAENVQTIG